MTPRLTVVLAVDAFSTARRITAALLEQTIAAQIELVLVGPAVVIPDEELKGLGAVRALRHSGLDLAGARAAGTLAATAPVIYIAETHAFPRPAALEILTESIEAGAAAVMPRFANANPATARSWASLFSTYGGFVDRNPRQLRHVSLHNGAFRADVLARVAADPDDLVYGIGLSRELRAERLSMRYVPEAVVDHENVASVRGVLVDRLLGSRIAAGLRARRWGTPRRALYVLGAPLLPVPLVARILRSPAWRERRRELPRGTATVLALSTVLVAVGELMGYVAGVGRASERHVPLELHRERYT